MWIWSCVKGLTAAAGHDIRVWSAAGCMCKKVHQGMRSGGGQSFNLPLTARAGRTRQGVRQTVWSVLLCYTSRVAQSGVWRSCFDRTYRTVPRCCWDHIEYPLPVCAPESCRASSLNHSTRGTPAPTYSRALQESHWMSCES